MKVMLALIAWFLSWIWGCSWIITKWNPPITEWYVIPLISTIVVLFFAGVVFIVAREWS